MCDFRTSRHDGWTEAGRKLPDALSRARHPGTHFSTRCSEVWRILLRIVLFLGVCCGICMCTAVSIFLNGHQALGSS